MTRAAWLTAILLLPTAGFAQEAGPAFGDRYDAFRLVLSEVGGSTPTLASPADFGAVEPAEWRHWIIVLLGPAALERGVPTDWDAFLQAGGTMLVATDRASGPILERSPTRFGAGPLLAPPGRSYLDRPLCPLIEDFPSRGDLLRGVKRLVLNGSGRIAKVDRPFTTVARAPRGSTIDGLEYAPAPAVIATATVGHGRLLLLADQNLLSNEMIFEADNLLFARNAARWLIGERLADTINVLVIEESRWARQWIDPRFESGEWRGPNWNDMIGMVNDVVKGLEDENIPNELIVEQSQRLSPRAARRGAVAVLSVALLLLLARWLVQGRSSLALRRGRPPARTAEGAEVADYRDAARRLAEDFVSRRLAPEPDDASRLSRRDRKRLRNLRGRMETLAAGADDRPISRSGFDLLLREVDWARDLIPSRPGERT